MGDLLIIWDENKGVGVSTAKSFKHGEILLEETALAAAFDVKVCGWCEGTAVRKCKNCRRVSFCSRKDCEEKCNNLWHKFECFALEKERLKGRSLILDHSKYRIAVQLLQKCGTSKCFATRTNIALENLRTRNIQEISTSVESYLAACPQHSGIKSVAMEFLHHAKLTKIKSKLFGDLEGEDAQAGVELLLNKITTNASLGIFEKLAMMNHSCLPNTEVTHQNGQIKLTAVGLISAGSEITHSYLPLEVFQRVRRQRLLNQYGFVCRCTRCEPTEETMQQFSIEEMAWCYECSRFMATQNDGVPTFVCKGCSKEVDQEIIENLKAQLMEKPTEEVLDRLSDFLHPANVICTIFRGKFPKEIDL